MRTNIQSVSKQINLDKAGYFISILTPFIILAFWPSYFSIIFSDIITPSFYSHFHGIMMLVWISLLIVQPILIRTKRLNEHRLLGKISYFVGPVVFISMLMITHQTRRVIIIPPAITFTNIDLWLICYTLAIVYRHKTYIHARAMIGTAISLLDPIFMRFMFFVIVPTTNLPLLVANFIGIGIVLGILITIIILERNQKQGRWIFPMILAYYTIAYSLISFDIKLRPDSFDKWFNSLPLSLDPKPTNNLADYTGVYSLEGNTMKIRDSLYYLKADNYMMVWKKNDEFFHTASESIKFERNDEGDVIALKKYFGDKVIEIWKKE
jgi:hypothetical protein